MSDVGDYEGYDDDFEDFLWEADPDPELADELAEHVLHSPVYRDEDAVQTELQDYFSDWEYYSDDYMDDDPALLRKHPQDGSSTKPAAKTKHSVKRGTKRKLSQVRDESLADGTLVQSITGVIWTKYKNPELPLYKDGQEKKVALMKNWRETFKTSGWSRTSDDFDEDESWAKDMSLADMGLQSVQRQASSTLR